MKVIIIFRGTGKPSSGGWEKAFLKSVKYIPVKLLISPSYFCSSDFYRCIKLFFVGNGKRGKTTLLRRLRGMSEDKKVERTAGIDIESWVYPEQKKIIKDKRKPVKFLAWDFAGQVLYQNYLLRIW